MKLIDIWFQLNGAWRDDEFSHQYILLTDGIIESLGRDAPFVSYGVISDVSDLYEREEK